MSEHRIVPPALSDPSAVPRHLPASWVAAYAEGRLAPRLRGRAEPHLLVCRRCADAVEAAVRRGGHAARLDALHTALLNRVTGGPPALPVPPPPAAPPQAPARPPARPALSAWLRLHRPPWLAATQVLRLPWLVAVACVTGLGVLFGHLSHSPTPRLALLFLAPVLPVLCVAGSYGGRADPFAEVTRTTPAGGLRILLVRTAQTLVVCVPLLTGAAATMPRAGLSPYTSAGWLLPCLTVTLATLLLSSYWGSWAAALTTGAGWFLLVYILAKPLTQRYRGDGSQRLLLALRDVQEQFVQAGGALVFGVVSAVLAELLVLRRHAFGRLGAR
ncbi:hypothetical protein ABZ330_11075 [Streptomyces sp. NPDC006172]|uniref:hypothetical protein n=1 Tax=Streptomyces sp. NPDC006172 TaxID=3154470 RepID=UPI0033E0124E